MKKTLADLIRNSPRYPMCRTFWEHAAEPTPDAPLFAYAPYLSRISAETKRNPFLQTITCQRVTALNFRREMFYALVDEPVLQLEFAAQANSFDWWSCWSDSNREFRAQVEAAASQSLLERSYLARQMCSLGFTAQGLPLVDLGFDQMDRFDLVQSYAYTTWFFLSEVAKPLSAVPFARKISTGYQKIPIVPESLRMRLCLAISACVYFGNYKCHRECQEWRAKGEALLQEFMALDLYEPFEKELLSSRFYRAVSYAPFLADDKQTLKRDAAAIESYARGLKPEGKFQRVLAHENLYPMLETCSRIWSFLGDPNRAYDLMTEISAQVDPLDPKAWLQAGEYKAKRGDWPGALEAYRKAGELAFPYGRVAWYKAGRILEKQGQLASAQDCYRNSLQLWPGGLSPQARLNVLAEGARA